MILKKYLDYAEFFLKKLAKKLLEYFKINKYINYPKKNILLFYGLIYSFIQIKLKIFKTHIKINLGNSFIKSFIFLAKAFIVFIQKLYNNFYI